MQPLVSWVIAFSATVTAAAAVGAYRRTSDVISTIDANETRSKTNRELLKEAVDVDPSSVDVDLDHEQR